MNTLILAFVLFLLSCGGGMAMAVVAGQFGMMPANRFAHVMLSAILILCCFGFAYLGLNIGPVRV